MIAFPILIRIIASVTTLLSVVAPLVPDLPDPADRQQAAPSGTLEPAQTPSPIDRRSVTVRHRTPETSGPDAAATGVPAVLASPQSGAVTEQWYPTRQTGDGRSPAIGRGATSASDDWPPSWPDAFTTGASCEVACILWGLAHDNGSHTSVYLNVKTTTPVLWTLHVTNDELGYDDTRVELTSWTTQAHATYTDLEAATTYHATVIVRDQWGNVEEASGSFTTSP